MQHEYLLRHRPFVFDTAAVVPKSSSVGWTSRFMMLWRGGRLHSCTLGAHGGAAPLL
jgi:hypothetical protein